MNVTSVINVHIMTFICTMPTINMHTHFTNKLLPRIVRLTLLRTIMLITYDIALASVQLSTPTSPLTEGKAMKLAVSTFDRSLQKSSEKKRRLVLSPGLTILICLDHGNTIRLKVRV